MDLESLLQRLSQPPLVLRFFLAIALGLVSVVVASTSVGCDEKRLSGPEKPPVQTPAEACLARAVFGDPSDSPYILPYRVGESYSLMQSYCGPYSHSRDNQLAYDFLLPFGAAVVAARAGIVRVVVDTWRDDDVVGAHNNHMFIEHEDGTTAMYAHLVQHSAAVQVNQSVVAGQFIALSGTSGTSIPHLHFGVYRTWPNRSGDDVAVNFRNADGALDARGGLQTGVSYLALPPSSGEPGAWE
jgi:murein DD-endopeptidase MepM/ murein hydrolase activator NlpD